MNATAYQTGFLPAAAARGALRILAAGTFLFLLPMTAAAQQPAAPVVAPGPAAAGQQEPAAAPKNQQQPAATAQPSAAADTATPAQPGRTSPDPCKIASPHDEELLDRSRREIFQAICGAAERFDHMFGNRRFDVEAQRTSGRVGVRLLYDQHDGFQPDGNLKVNVDFPNFQRRVNAFFGRDDRDQFVRGRDNQLDFLPAFFRREGNEEWLAGFGYAPVRGDRDKVRFDAGVQGGSPIETFARGTYRHYDVFGKNLVRARQTLYWTNERHFGGSTRFDVERPFGERTLARGTLNGTIDGQTEGTDWDTGVTLYHGFTPTRAIAWYVGLSGATGRQVPLEEYGTSATYRQRMLREWFFGEIIGGVTWPRDNLLERRQTAHHIGFGFEIQFSGEAFGF